MTFISVPVTEVDRKAVSTTWGIAIDRIKGYEPDGTDSIIYYEYHRKNGVNKTLKSSFSVGDIDAAILASTQGDFVDLNVNKEYHKDLHEPYVLTQAVKNIVYMKDLSSGSEAVIDTGGVNKPLEVAEQIADIAITV